MTTVRQNSSTAPVGGAVMGMVDRRRGVAWVVLSDVLVVSIAALVTLQVWLGIPPDSSQVDSLTGHWLFDFGLIVPLWVAALAVSDAYSRRFLARSTDELRAVLRGSLVAAAAAAMLAYLINYDVSRGFFLGTFALGTTGLLAKRVAARRWSGSALYSRRVVAIGPCHLAHELDVELSRAGGHGLGLVGICTPDGASCDACGAPVLGRCDEAVRALRSVGADTLVVLEGAFASPRDLRRLAWELEGTSVELAVAPSLVDVAGPRIHIRPTAGLPLVYVEPPQAQRALRWGKAWFDRVGAALLVCLLAPILAVIAIAVAVDSRGPILFRHRRVGLHGREFSLWKFRSMTVEAEERQEALVIASGGDALLFKIKDDPRVTRVGRFIRKYSLDELPQLFNVLAGEMSLVGPRPQVAAEVASYEQDSFRRLVVRPGMTGLWQVSGRSELSVQESMRLDLYYVDNWSMAGDLVILARTIGAVFRHDGAY